MPRAEGFPPVAAADARILILGSLPGQRSIAAGEYYAHPRNAFWTIADALFGARGSYRQRCETLLDARVALWDVLRASSRPGSLDANIKISTAQANDFEAFFARCPGIECIGFNGKKAEQLFKRFVPCPDNVRCLVLPSTSPAYASLSVSGKLAAWSRLVE